MIARIKHFKNFLGREVWRHFLFAIAVGFLWFAVESLFAYVLQGFLSTLGLIPKVNLGRVAEYYPTTVGGAVALLIGFGFFRATIIFLRYHTANVTSQAFIRFQRSRILRYSLEYAHLTNTTDAVTLFNERVTESGRVIQNFVSVVNLTTAIVLFSLLSLYMTPIEFLIGMFILAIALAPIRRLNKVVGLASSGILTESKKVTHSLLVGLRNQFLLRIYGEVEPVVKSGFEALKRYENHFKRYSIVYCLNGSFPNFIGVLAVAIVTFVSLTYLKTSSSALLAFFYLFFRIAQSASETSAILNEARVYFESFKSLMKFAEKADQAPTELTTDEHKGGGGFTELRSLEIESLGFSWPNGVTVFRGLTARVQRGEVLLIKGESGSGKSTLLSLVSGLLVPSEGKLFYNGLPLQQMQRSQVARKIGYVGPESYIVEGTLRENLLFAHSSPSNISEVEMLEALRQVELDKEFDRAGVKFDTYFNEFTQLSTGQKQRLAVARALLRKPELLILDEATANLDGETEARLIRNLRVLQQNRITLVVSHRDSFDAIANSKIEMGNLRSS